jgi:hypothetical protein
VVIPDPSVGSTHHGVQEDGLLGHLRGTMRQISRVKLLDAMRGCLRRLENTKLLSPNDLDIINQMRTLRQQIAELEKDNGREIAVRFSA